MAEQYAEKKNHIVIILTDIAIDMWVMILVGIVIFAFNYVYIYIIKIISWFFCWGL